MNAYDGANVWVPKAVAIIGGAAANEAGFKIARQYQKHERPGEFRVNLAQTLGFAVRRRWRAGSVASRLPPAASRTRVRAAAVRCRGRDPRVEVRVGCLAVAGLDRGSPALARRCAAGLRGPGFEGRGPGRRRGSRAHPAAGPLMVESWGGCLRWSAAAVMGRPRKLTAAQQAEARRRRAEGATLRRTRPQLWRGKGHDFTSRPRFCVGARQTTARLMKSIAALGRRASVRLV